MQINTTTPTTHLDGWSQGRPVTRGALILLCISFEQRMYNLSMRSLHEAEEQHVAAASTDRHAQLSCTTFTARASGWCRLQIGLVQTLFTTSACSLSMTFATTMGPVRDRAVPCHALTSAARVKGAHPGYLGLLRLTPAWSNQLTTSVCPPYMTPEDCMLHKPSATDMMKHDHALVFECRARVAAPTQGVFQCQSMRQALHAP